MQEDNEIIEEVKDLTIIDENKEVTVRHYKDQTDLVKTNTFLKCSHCYIKDRCPSFVENGECNFQISVDRDSPKMAKDIILDLINIQYGRVVKGKMIEEADGGLPDKALSNEIQLLMTLMEQAKNIMSEEKNTIKIEAKGKEATQSIMSQIFGDMLPRNKSE